MIGSFGSSFSDAAWQLNGIEKEIARVLPTPSVAFSGKLETGDLADDASCFETLRRVRWDKGIFCPECGGDEFSQSGSDDALPHLRRYYCHNCVRSFDDLTGTVFSKQPAAVRNWLLCLYYMEHDTPSREISRTLDLEPEAVEQMISLLR